MSPFDSSASNREQDEFRAEAQNGFLEVTDADIEELMSPDRGFLRPTEKKALLDGLAESEIEFFAGMVLMIREQRPSEDVVRYVLGAIGQKRIHPAHWERLDFFVEYFPILEFFSSYSVATLPPDDCLAASHDKEMRHPVWQQIKESPFAQLGLENLAAKGDALIQNNITEIRSLLASIPNPEATHKSKPLRQRIAQLLSFGMVK